MSSKWNGMCESGKHGLDFEGQTCDVCLHDAQPGLDPKTCPMRRNCRVCFRLRGGSYPIAGQV